MIFRARSPSSDPCNQQSAMRRPSNKLAALIERVALETGTRRTWHKSLPTSDFLMRFLPIRQAGPHRVMAEDIAHQVNDCRGDLTGGTTNGNADYRLPIAYRLAGPASVGHSRRRGLRRAPWRLRSLGGRLLAHRYRA